MGLRAWIRHLARGPASADRPGQTPATDAGRIERLKTLIEGDDAGNFAEIAKLLGQSDESPKL